MTAYQFLLSFTFVYGILRLITLTKLFNYSIQAFFEAFSINGKFFKYLDVIIIIGSLIIQSHYWLFLNK